MNKEEIQKVIDRLNAAIPGGVECPMCHARDFRVVTGSISNVVQTGLHELALAGRSIPSLMIVCSKCGFMSQHSIGVLCQELLNTTDTSDDK